MAVIFFKYHVSSGWRYDFRSREVFFDSGYIDPDVCEIIVETQTLGM